VQHAVGFTAGKAVVPDGLVPSWLSIDSRQNGGCRDDTARRSGRFCNAMNVADSAEDAVAALGRLVVAEIADCPN
jgi:hypothetical protein